MSKFLKNPSSFGIEKLTSDVLLRRTSAVGGNNEEPVTRLTTDGSNLRVSKSQTVVDNWVRNAMSRKDSSREEEVKLELPIILKTLQRLRSTDSRSSYFALLSKIQSSRIQWLTNAGKPISNSGAVPVEFYNEVSSMIYRISLGCDMHGLQMLSRFLLKLLASYNQSLEQRAALDFKVSGKFLRNCLLPIAKTGSVSLVNEALKRTPPDQKNVKCLVELAYYYHSSQFTKVLCQLKHLNATDFSPSQEEFDAFFPLLFDVMQAFVVHGDEKSCVQLITNIIERWGYQIDSHHAGILRDLSEKFAANQVLNALGTSSPLLQWKLLQSRMTWEQLMSHLKDLNVDLFKESQDLDFSQRKLSVIPPSIADWKQFLSSEKSLVDGEPSLRSFTVNTILTHLVGEKKLPFIVSILEHMVYDLQCGQAFIDTGRLQGCSKYSGFHCLFKACSMSSSSILSSNVLLKFLQENQQIPFRFSTADFYFMMLSCLTGTDHHPLYYFLFQYYRIMGSSLYDERNGTVFWALPSSIEQLLRCKVANRRSDTRVMEIMQEVQKYFTERSPRDRETGVDLAHLQNIFADKYISSLTVKSMIALEKKQKGQNFIDGGRYYSPASDLQTSVKLRRVLQFIKENTSI